MNQNRVIGYLVIAFIVFMVLEGLNVIFRVF